MRWVALALVIASASCPHRTPPPPLCNMERPEYLVPSCHLYVVLRNYDGESRSVPAVWASRDALSRAARGPALQALHQQHARRQGEASALQRYGSAESCE